MCLTRATKMSRIAQTEQSNMVAELQKGGRILFVRLRKNDPVLLWFVKWFWGDIFPFLKKGKSIKIWEKHMSNLSGIRYSNETQLLSYSLMHKILDTLTVFRNVYTLNPSQNCQPETVLQFMRPHIG